MRRVALLLAATALTTLAARADDEVVVRLSGGATVRARRAETRDGHLALELPDGSERTLPMAVVASVEFRPAFDLSQVKGLPEAIQAVRRRPFAGPEFASLTTAKDRAALASRAATLEERLRLESDPLRRERQALNLAGLRWALDDAPAALAFLRTAKALSRDRGDWNAYNACCVRLAALQLPAAEPTPRDWERCRAELEADILDEDQRADLKARIRTLFALSVQAGT